MSDQNASSVIPAPVSFERKTESQSLTDPFASAPEIYGENISILDKYVDIPLLADQLTTEAKKLIEILGTRFASSDIRNQFQIELRKLDTSNVDSSTYRMSLRIDSVLWFKQHSLNTNNTENLDELYDMGVRYVDRVKSETECYSENIDEHKVKRIPIPVSSDIWCFMEEKGNLCPYKDNSKHQSDYKHYQWCSDENIGTNGECTSTLAGGNHFTNFIHTAKIDEDKKPYYQCRNRSIKLDRTHAFCLFKADPNFWIYHARVIKSSHFPYFIAASRNDATPVITLNPVKHCSNEEYVQSTDAWQAVLQTLIYMKEQLKLDKLPLDRIYINFGKWQTQKAGNPLFRDCHAHINIVLTRQTIEKISNINLPHDKKHKGKKLFPSLVGSVLPPKLHRFDDSVILIEYMNNAMVHVIFKRNRELVRRISSLKEEVEKLKEENEKFKRYIYGPTRPAEEEDDTLNGTDATDTNGGIDDLIFTALVPSDSCLE